MPVMTRSGNVIMANELITELNALRLYGMVTAVEELLAERPRKSKNPLNWVTRLVEAEQVEW